RMGPQAVIATMNMLKIAAAALALGLASAGGATAAAPRPSPEFEAFAKGLEGSWKCESTTPAGAMGPGSPGLKLQGTAKLKRDLGGMWVVGRLDIAKTKTHPAFTGAFSFGTDGKQFISSNIDSGGNAGLTFGALTDPANITTTGEGT